MCNTPKPIDQNNKPCPTKTALINPNTISKIPKYLMSLSVYLDALIKAKP